MRNGFSAEEIEQATLSCMMQNQDCLDRGVTALTANHFFEDRHKKMFAFIHGYWEDRKPIDLIGITHALRESKLLDAIGGTFYITNTWTICLWPSLSILEYYMEILSDYLSRRSLISTCSDASTRDWQGSDDAVGEVIEELSDIPRYSVPTEQSLSSLAAAKMERMEHAEPDADILKTGIVDLDRKSPMRKGNMPIIAGDRKAGKTILALSIATNIAKTGKHVLYFSLEDKAGQVFDRLLAGMSRVELHKDHVAKLSTEETKRVAKATGDIQTLPITIRDEAMDLGEIIAESRKLVKHKDVRLIIVDYVQLVRANGCESRREEVEKVSRELRLLAMALNVPLILVCQLNQEGGTRETRALEMDATAMWRIEAIEDEPKHRQILIPWQRNGEPGERIEVTFLGQYARVENYIDEKKSLV